MGLFCISALQAEQSHNLRPYARRLQAQEARLGDAQLRYESGLFTLSSALRQLQSADEEGRLDVLGVLGHYQGASAGQGAAAGQWAVAEPQMSVEELVDEILFHVHRRCI